MKIVDTRNLTKSVVCFVLLSLPSLVAPYPFLLSPLYALTCLISPITTMIMYSMQQIRFSSIVLINLPAETIADSLNGILWEYPGNLNLFGVRDPFLTLIFLGLVILEDLRVIRYFKGKLRKTLLKYNFHWIDLQ